MTRPCSVRGGNRRVSAYPPRREWERVAKGPTDEARRWPWPEGGPTCQNTVYYTNYTLCEPEPVAVGSRSPAGDSEEGVQDLSGNVAEWVSDWYARYEADAQTDPRGPSSGTHKILRGGGFSGDQERGSNARKDTCRSRQTFRRSRLSMRLISLVLLMGCSAEVLNTWEPEPAWTNDTVVSWETLVEGLDEPRGIVALDNGGWAVAERGAGRVIRIDEVGSMEVLVDGLIGPWGLAEVASDVLLVSDRDGGQVLLIEGDMVTTIEDGLIAPTEILMSGAEGYFIDEEAGELWSTDLSEGTLLASNLDTPTGSRLPPVASTSRSRVARIGFLCGTIRRIVLL